MIKEPVVFIIFAIRKFKAGNKDIWFKILEPKSHSYTEIIILLVLMISLASVDNAVAPFYKLTVDNFLETHFVRAQSNRYIN